MGKIKIGNYRYRILALLFMATTINYFDRSILGVMADVLQKRFGWTNVDYGNITISFQLAYAIGLISMGGFIDRLGTKKGYLTSIAIWSFFGMLHATIRPAFSLIGFVCARFGLGFGESGNFPAAIKATAEWFPKKDRAFATGIFNAATSVGAILAPIAVGLIVEKNGDNWQFPFLITAALSATWVFLWQKTYQSPQKHSKVSKEELNYILSDSEEETLERIPWLNVLFKKETWAFALVKSTDAVWWFYLFWGAKFLNAYFNVDIKHIALPFFILYILADCGSIFGGFLSSSFIKKGWSINKSRKITLLICALIILPVMFAAQTESKWIAIFLIGLGAAGHQAWSANIFTLVSDIFPKKAIASVVGIGGMVGSLTSIVATFLLASTLDGVGRIGYFYAFLLAGSIYLITLFFSHLINPKMLPLDEQLNIKEKSN